MEGQKTHEITDKFFEQDPFIIKLGIEELTSNILNTIYECSNSFKDDIKQFEISGKKYDISFEKEGNFISIKFRIEGKLIYDLIDVLEKPKDVVIDIRNIKIKNVKIFSLEAYEYIKLIFSRNDKYVFKDDEENNKIQIKSKNIEISDEIINIYLDTDDNYKNYDTAIILKNNIELNPLFLSSNFFDIFPEIQRNKKFELIINQERKIFLQKLKSFIENKKNYYWFIGSDGIGKTISLLYFSSLKNYETVYFNLKLYSDNLSKIEMQKLFYNDIHKLYLKYIKNNEYGNSTNIKFSEHINKIEKGIDENFDPNISVFWNYLYNFINVKLWRKYIIIIDQYKNDNDPHFKGLNKIVDLLRNYKLNIKIILSTSINNADSKENFIKYLNNIYNMEDNPISSELILEIEKENNDIDFIFEEETQSIQFEDEDDKDNKSDCSFCQNIIDEAQNKLKNENINKDEEKMIINSECHLDQNSIEVQKDYYCSLVSGKEIYKKLLNQDEYIIAKNFNYSLKYIIKYLNLKNKEISIDNKDKDPKVLINKFYKIESDKMKKKINEFYVNIGKTKGFDYIDIFNLEFKSLCKLRSYILENKKFQVQDLSNEIYYFPLKYLNIILYPFNTKDFSLNQDLTKYKFKIQYNNNFSRIQINCLINDIFKKITNISLNSIGGSAAGDFLEIKIDEMFRNNINNKFGYYKYNCRYLFSLVKNTKNSPKTIEFHRKNEKNIISLFFGENAYNKIIDDIDDIKDKNHFILDEEVYYFSQISYTGRAFDMAVLKKVGKNCYCLFLFQVSKNKNKELKEKLIYISEANNVANNFKNIYGIEINRIYLTFILPLIGDTDYFQKKLSQRGLNYIFFNTFTNIFVDKINKQEINSLELEDSLLDYNPNYKFDDLVNVIISNNIWVNSIKSFLNKKIYRDNVYDEGEIEITDKDEKDVSLHKIYINNLFKLKNYKQTKLIIPDNLIKIIEKEIIREENIKLKFLNNFDLSSLKKVASLYRTLIIFSKNKNIYIYYEFMYSYKNNKFSRIDNIDDILNDKSNKIIKKKSSKQTDKDKKKYNEEINDLEKKEIAVNEIKEKFIKINFEDLKDEKYDRKCFSYLIIDKDYVKSLLEYETS